MVDKVSLRVLVIRRRACQTLRIDLGEAHHSRTERRVHAQLHHKRQGKAVIGATKERQEDVHATLRVDGLRQPAVDVQRDVRVRNRKHLAEELRLHDRRLLRALALAKQRVERRQRARRRRAVRGAVVRERRAAAPREDDQLRRGLARELRDRRREVLEADDRERGRDGHAVQVAERAEDGEDRVPLRDDVRGLRLEHRGRALRELDEAQDVDRHRYGGCVRERGGWCGRHRLLLVSRRCVTVRARGCCGGGSGGLEELRERHECWQLLDAVHDEGEAALDAVAERGRRARLADMRRAADLVGSGACAVFGRVEEERERRGHEGQHEGVQNEHGECARVEDAGRETNVQDNEFDKARECLSDSSNAVYSEHVPLATHQRANSTGLAERKAAELGCHRAPQELGKERNRTDQDGVAPCHAIIQETQVGLQS